MNPCNCSKRAVKTTLRGEWMHETLSDGTWCGVLTPGGMFHPKTLLEPTQAYLDAEATRQAMYAAQEAKDSAKAAKVASGKSSLAALKAKLDDGKALTAEDDKAAIAAIVELLAGE